MHDETVLYQAALKRELELKQEIERLREEAAFREREYAQSGIKEWKESSDACSMELQRARKERDGYQAERDLVKSALAVVATTTNEVVADLKSRLASAEDALQAKNKAADQNFDRTNAEIETLRADLRLAQRERDILTASENEAFAKRMLEGYTEERHDPLNAFGRVYRGLRNKLDAALLEIDDLKQDVACKHFFDAARHAQTMEDLGPGTFALCGHLEGSGLSELLEQLKQERDSARTVAIEEAALRVELLNEEDQRTVGLPDAPAAIRALANEPKYLVAVKPCHICGSIDAMVTNSVGICSRGHFSDPKNLPHYWVAVERTKFEGACAALNRLFQTSELTGYDYDLRVLNKLLEVKDEEDE